MLSRQPEQLEEGVRHRVWDGRTIGPWTDEIDGADVVVNLAGRSVSCRYTDANLKQMMDSRIESTRVVGEAIAQASTPPPTWLQMSTATIYAHRFDAPNDEASGIIGGNEPDTPAYWEYSTRIAKRWEAEQAAAATPRTRKVALRSAMVMSPDKGGVLDVLLTMARLGLGGPVAGGNQFVSWIHETDFVRACNLLIEREDISGPVNLTAPGPLPQRDLMRTLRKEAGVPTGLPATRWMAEIGAWALRTDTELLLKSRRVVPGRLLEAGFEFEYADWTSAAHDLVGRARQRNQSHRPAGSATMKR
ncbi:NAD-dependent epimerase [Nocardioides albus]|nr:NAD-dependent epimerase [Nocardioides albus]